MNSSSSSIRLLLLSFMLVGLILRVGAAVRFPTIYHSDEIFQTQEPAHRLAYGYGVVTWEWRQGARSWVFPAFLAGVMRSTDWMGSGSAGYQLGMIVVLSLISLTAIWFAFAWAKRVCGTDAAIIAAGAGAFWYEMVYFAPKALNEVVAAHALLPGLYLGKYAESLGERKRLLLAGGLMGLAVALRIHLAPVVGFAAICFCYPNWRRRLLPLAAGLLMPLLAFGLVDALTWSHPFQSVLVYYQSQSRFITVPSLPGVEGGEGATHRATWYAYLLGLFAHLGPVAFLVLWGIRRSPFLGWIMLIHFAFHSLFKFHNLRYLYPILPLEITLAALALAELAPALNPRRIAKPSASWMVGGSLAFLALCSCLLVPEINWRRGSGNLFAMDRLSSDSTLCGVGIYRIPWYAIADYAHLHRNVPIVLMKEVREVQEQAPSFNALIIDGTLQDPSHRYELEGCWSGICVYRRLGPCEAPRADYEVNSTLRREGW